MDHRIVDECNLTERYVLGQLRPDERTRFEEHYLDCPECLDRIAAAEGLLDGLRLVAAEDALAAAPRTRPGFLAWWASAGWRQRGAFLSVAAALIILPLTVGAWWHQLQVDRLQLALAVAVERPPFASTPVRPADPGEVAAAAPLFRRWGVSRGQHSPESRVLEHAGSKRWVVVLIEQPFAREMDSYRATISTVGGAEVWQQDGLRQEETAEGLPLLIRTDLLAPGEYLLTLEGFASGRYSPWARLPFRVLP